ncbi:MAG TPA: rRNA pseudouridine synthase [Acidiferrobacteraceae bacterium]|nr:rRNA pseudouridine synthase [Acidiferrobacteraceae bacterium]
MEKIRLSKLMAQRGLCSRREADAYIEKGWVRVDGQRINTLGTKIDPSQAIALDKRASSRQDKLITILLNKPVGYVSGQPEDDHLEAVSLINKENRYAYDTSKRPFQPVFRRGLAPAGRLDIDSQGLLILTADGRIARRLIGNDAEVEKEYLVRVTGNVTNEKLERLRHGLSLDDRPLKPAQVQRQNQDQLKFILVEGRKRQIRRMCELVGLEATGLKRVRIGEVKLGRLPEGQWRLLGDKEHF